MSNIVSEFTDSQKFNPMLFDDADEGSVLTKFQGSVLWQNLQLPSVIKTVDPTAVPPDETLGNLYILHNNSGAVHANWDSCTKNDLAYFDGTTWQPITPVTGQTCYDKERNCLAKFNGSKWLYDECYGFVEMDVADIQASNKVDIVSPVAATDILDPISCVAYLNFNSAAYVNAASLGLYAENNANQLMQSDANLITATSSMIMKLYQKDPQEIVIGDKLQLATTANVITGDSKIRVYLKYRIIQL